MLPLRVISYSDSRPLVGAGEAHLDGELWPHYRLIVTASDAGDEVISAVPCPPPEPLPLRGHVHTLDEQSWTWSTELTLDGARDARWTAIKEERDRRSMPAQVSAGGLVWDTNARSRELIRDALMTASIVGPTWSSMWTLADNTRFLATATDLQGVVLAYAAVTEAVFQTAAAMREQIDAAASIYDLNAITWPAP